MKTRFQAFAFDKCNLYRYVVALDGFMFKYCQELAKDGIKIRCARSTSQESTTTATSEEEEDDVEFSPGALAAHMSGRWAEINSIVSRGNNAWALDVGLGRWAPGAGSGGMGGAEWAEAHLCCSFCARSVLVLRVLLVRQPMAC